MLSMCLLFCIVIFWMLCCVMCEKKKKKKTVDNKNKTNANVRHYIISYQIFLYCGTAECDIVFYLYLTVSTLLYLNWYCP